MKALKKKRITKALGAPDYITALSMKKGGFKDIETYNKALELNITSLDEHKFMNELNHELKTK